MSKIRAIFTLDYIVGERQIVWKRAGSKSFPQPNIFSFNTPVALNNEYL